MDMDTYNIKDPAEKALDIMEHPKEVADEELQALLQDQEAIQFAKDILDSSFVLQSTRQKYMPDVEQELATFKKKRRKQRTYTLWKTGISIAACIALCIGLFSYLDHQAEKNAATVVTFTADNSPQQVTLDKGDGKKIVLSERKPNSSAQPSTSSQSLNYTPTTKYTTTQTHSLTVPRGGTFKLTLYDGTEVWLNANSHFVYPTVFAEKERVVYLEGEAYFKVAKDTNHPFIVKTSHVQTRVLGTEFNIRSYTPEDIHVVLISGKVEVSNRHNNAYTALAPGEDAHLQPDGNFIMKEVALEPYIYWKDGYFYFDDATLKDIMENIGRWYNINVEFRNPDAMKHKMHFVSDRTKPLEETIHLLNRLKKVTATLKNNTIIID